MNQSMAGSATLNLTQSDKIAPVEVAASMLEFPQRGVWRAGVEDIADLVEAVHVKLTDKGRDVCVLEVRSKNFGEFCRW